MIEIQHHSLPDGRRIAYRYRRGHGPTLVFLPGYMSDMEGSKALAVFAQAQQSGQAALLFDYSGCGASSGDFHDGSVSLWRDETVAMIEATCEGPVILIGSSMGGWIMLLTALALSPDRVAGLIGIAPAPDFTDWGKSETEKARLATGETLYDDNPYGPEPTPTHAHFWADGQQNLLLENPIALNCPVRILHGQHDPDVPWELSVRIAEALHSDDVQLTFIKDGDHRLSREHDIALLLQTVNALTSAIRDR